MEDEISGVTFNLCFKLLQCNEIIQSQPGTWELSRWLSQLDSQRLCESWVQEHVCNPSVGRAEMGRSVASQPVKLMSSRRSETLYLTK